MNAQMSIRILVTLTLLVGSVGTARNACAIDIPVDSTTSYLDNVGNANNTATIIELSTLMAGPGDSLRLEALGEYSLNGTETGPNASLSNAMIGVFSASETLLDVDASNPRLRVVDAIDAGDDFATESDIAEDFFIDNVVVEIPSGATHLFVAALDTFQADNSDDDNDFALRATVMVPEPASAILFGLAFALGCARLGRGPRT